LHKEKIEAVVLFAAFAYVGESVREPLKYFQNNVSGTISLLNAIKKAKISKFVFSSTCATYGMPEKTPIAEETPQNPINPYGLSKLMVEQILRAECSASSKERPFNAVALRYFNAAGADTDGEIGEDHNPETHLIPLAIEAAMNPEKTLTVFGKDYPTPDGTCVRDYIHVTDLAQAHVKALESLQTATGFSAYNLGAERGVSVLEIVNAIENAPEARGAKVRLIWGERRPGDPPELVAAAQRAREILGWQPQHSRIENIVSTALRWHQKHQSPANLKKGEQ
jgi:UDP-glucose 4-epimerase